MLQVIGCNHHEIPPSRLSAVTSDREAWLAKLLREKDADRCRGAVLLATCNRLEVVIDAEEPLAAEHLIGPHPHHDHQEHDAARYLLRVATGLDSVVRGEDQIHGQLREAFKLAERHDLLSPKLRVLRNELIAAARDIRQRTGLSKSRVSIASLAASELEQSGGRLVVIGAGDTGRLALESLCRREHDRVVLVNRTEARARAMADHFGIEAMGLSEFLSRQESSTPQPIDGILLAVHSPTPLLHARHIRGVHRVIDVSMPSVLATDVRDTGAEVLDLDTIAAGVDRACGRHQAVFETAEDLVRGRAMAMFRAVWGTGRGGHLARILEQHVEVALREVDEMLTERLGHLCPKDQEEIRTTVLRATRHNAHRHLKDIKEYSGA